MVNYSKGGCVGSGDELVRREHESILAFVKRKMDAEKLLRENGDEGSDLDLNAIIEKTLEVRKKATAVPTTDRGPTT